MPADLENSAVATGLEKVRFHSNPKEEQEAIRKPSSVINAKKERKTTEWERLEISSRKLEIPREHFMQRWAQERTEMAWI